MTQMLERSRALFATILLLSTVSCGPKVVVARIATPTAEVPRPSATPTPTPRRRAAEPAPPPASPAPPSPRPTATARPPTPTPTATVTPVTYAVEPSSTPTFSPSRQGTPTAPPAPARPSPSATATPAPARPSAAPAETTTWTPIPPPTGIPARPTAPPATPVSAASAASEPPPITARSTPSWIGEWDFRADAGKGIIAGSLRFREAGTGIAGTYAGLRGNTTELSNLQTAGDRISFDLVTPRAVWHLVGTLSGDRIEGTFQTAERTIPWSAARKGTAPTPSRPPS